VVISGWHILTAPAGTPTAVLNRLNAALVGTIKRADISEKLVGVGVRPVSSTIEEAQTMLRSENQRWREVARKAGMKAE